MIFYKVCMSKVPDFDDNLHITLSKFVNEICEDYDEENFEYIDMIKDTFNHCIKYMTTEEINKPIYKKATLLQLFGFSLICGNDDITGKEDFFSAFLTLLERNDLEKKSIECFRCKSLFNAPLNIIQLLFEKDLLSNETVSAITSSIFDTLDIEHDKIIFVHEFLQEINHNKNKFEFADVELHYIDEAVSTEFTGDLVKEPPKYLSFIKTGLIGRNIDTKILLELYNKFRVFVGMNNFGNCTIM